MRVLHVSDCYLPRLGGIETQVHALARRQRARGLDVEVLTATPRARHDRTGLEVIDGVPVHRASADLPFELPVHPRTAAVVAAALHRASALGRGYDVAHVHVGVVSPFAYGALRTLADARLPAVVTVHSMWGPAAPLLRPLDRWLGLSRPCVVVGAVSSVAADPLRRRGIETRIIPNGIDVAQWLTDPLPQPRRSDDEVLIVAVMRLARRKRGRALLAALRAVRERVPGSTRLRAVIAGEGPDRRRLERYLAGPGRSVDMADWVGLPGRRTPAQVRELYRRADLFVSAARLESFGIAALEARAAGVPVVAMATGGAGEFVTDGVHGLLVADDAQLADAVGDLVVDPGRRAAMAAAARAEPPPTTWPEVLARCDAAYADAGGAAAAVG